MLKNLNVLHTPELLHVLASMGHGDDVALVDCNFPAVSVAQRLVRLDGTDLPAALEACLQLMPIDTFVDTPRGDLERIETPTLVLMGSDDHDTGSGQDLAAALPQGQYVVIPGNHMSAVTKPELGAAIADFLGDSG